MMSNNNTEIYDNFSRHSCQLIIDIVCKRSKGKIYKLLIKVNSIYYDSVYYIILTC